MFGSETTLVGRCAGLPVIPPFRLSNSLTSTGLSTVRRLDIHPLFATGYLHACPAHPYVVVCGCSDGSVVFDTINAQCSGKGALGLSSRFGV